MSKYLILLGSSREGRSTGNVAKAVERKFKEEETEVELFDLKEKPLPILKERRFNTENPDPNVEELGSKIEEAETLVIVSPEYNHSFPGVLKNALDHFYPEFEDKLFAYVTTSAGGFGGIRQQSHLHDFTLAVNAIPGPNIPVSKIRQNFEEGGKINSEEYETRIEEFVTQVIEETEKK